MTDSKNTAGGTEDSAQKRSLLDGKGAFFLFNGIPAVVFYSWFAIRFLNMPMPFFPGLSRELLLIPSGISLAVFLLSGRWMRLIGFPFYLVVFPVILPLWLLLPIIRRTARNQDTGADQDESTSRKGTRGVSSTHAAIILVFLSFTAWTLAFAFKGIAAGVASALALLGHIAIYLLFLQSFLWATNPYRPLNKAIEQILRLCHKYLGPWFETLDRSNHTQQQQAATLLDLGLKIINSLYSPDTPYVKGILGLARTYVLPIAVLFFIVAYTLLGTSFAFSLEFLEASSGPHISGIAATPLLRDYLYLSFLSQATAIPDQVRPITIVGQIWIAWMVLTGVLLLTMLITTFTTSLGLHGEQELNEIEHSLDRARSRLNTLQMAHSNIGVENETDSIDGRMRLLESSPVEATSDEVAELLICSAIYGAREQVKDVTELIASKSASGHLRIRVTNDNLGGDPSPGLVKDLTIVYSYGGVTSTATTRENEELSLP